MKEIHALRTIQKKQADTKESTDLVGVSSVSAHDKNDHRHHWMVLQRRIQFKFVT